MLPEHAHENMVEQQIRPWDVLDQRILNVLGSVPRGEFVQPEHRGIAFSDYQLPIGHGQSLLKPNIDGRILQALMVEADESILEIGTGSGYLAACLSSLGKQITSIEINEALSVSATERLARLGYTNVTTKVQDAAVAWDADDHYDAIALTGSVEIVPDFYRQKLTPGRGRMFVVIGNEMSPTMEAQLIVRASESEWIKESLFETSLTPLKNFETVAQTFSF